MSDQVVVHKTCEVDGKLYAFSSDTVFLVQVGRGSKGSYRTERSFVGNMYHAVRYYAAINIGNGYKKRLCYSGKVILRDASY